MICLHLGNGNFWLVDFNLVLHLPRFLNWGFDLDFWNASLAWDFLPRIQWLGFSCILVVTFLSGLLHIAHPKFLIISFPFCIGISVPLILGPIVCCFSSDRKLLQSGNMFYGRYFPQVWRKELGLLPSFWLIWPTGVTPPLLCASDQRPQWNYTHHFLIQRILTVHRFVLF